MVMPRRERDVRGPTDTAKRLDTVYFSFHSRPILKKELTCDRDCSLHMHGYRAETPIPIVEGLFYPVCCMHGCTV